MQKKYDTTVLGLYVLDILGRPVSKIPEGGNLAYIEELRLTVAGTAGGTVVDCAKLGVSTLGVGAVGDDEKADFVISTLKKFGVDTAGFERLKGIPTSSTILNIRPNGERPALHLRGACDHF
jgi:Sugar kinases, ribokinase family